MNSNELEQMLDGAHETQGFEVKGPMHWKVSSLAKDILAMSNLRDGGVILFGVEDGTFSRLGMTPDELASFKVDVMRDQMASYADPSVEFRVDFPTDQQGLKYVVIRVNSFREVPVICRRDSVDTTAGTIYYRTSHRRVESAPVSSSADMREIITVAASRVGQRLEDLGWAVGDVDEAWRTRLDAELEGL